MFANEGEDSISAILKTSFARRLFSSGFRRFGASLALTAAIAACSGGSPTVRPVPPQKDTAPPEFKGVILSYSSGKGTLSLHWPVAADNATPAAKMAYSVYVGGSADPGALAQSSNLKMTVSNKTTASVYGLTPGGVYFCLVKAVDEAGNKSLNTAVSTVMARTADLVVDATPKVLEKMSVTVAQTDADSAVISGPDAAMVRANDVLVVNNPYGQSLKKVVSAEIGGGSNAVTFRDSSLGEVVRSGGIGNAVSMTSLANLPTQKTGAETPGVFDLRYKDPAGFFEITEYGLVDNAAKAAKNMAKYNSMAALATDVTLGYTILFEPELTADVEFDSGRSPNSLSAIRVAAKGSLSFDAMASFEITGAVSRDVTTRILNRSAVLNYSIGAIPVVQETYLEVMAHLELKTDVPLNMFAELSTAKAVDMAFEWNRESGWRQVTSDSFDQRITLNIMSAGRIVGTLELYPIISTRFYKAAKSGSYKVPKLNLNADVRIIPPPLEISVFDPGIHVDSYLAVSPKVFGFTIAEWEKEQAQIQNQKLYIPPPVASAAAPGLKGATGTDVPLELRVAGAKPVEMPAAGVDASSAASFSFTGLIPEVLSTSAAPYKAAVTASGANLKNVNKVTLSLVRTKTGAKAGTYIWIKKGKLRERTWNAKVTVNPDGSLTLRPVVTTRGDPAHQTTWTVTLTDGHTTASQAFMVDYANAASAPKIASTAPVEKAQAPIAPPPAPPKVIAPVEKAQAPVAPPPAPPKVIAPVEKAQAPATPTPAPPKVIAPVEKAKASATPPPAPPKVIAPVEKAQAPIAPPPAPPKVIAPVEKAQAPATPTPAPPKVIAPVEKAKASATPTAPVAASPKVSASPGIGNGGAEIANLMGGAIQKPLTLSGAVSTFAGGVGVAGVADGATAAARFNYINGITTDLTNLYVTDQNSGTIRKIVIATGAVTTLAGSVGTAGAADGTGTAAQFNLPEGITTDGKNLYVADKYNNAIRKIAIATGAVTTLAGSPGAAGATDGTGTAARFTAPTGITTDGANLYVADKGNHTIRKIVIATGGVSTLAGGAGTAGETDGMGVAARFNGPTGITTDGANLYVADQYNYAIRKIVIATGAVATLAGKAKASGAVDGTGAAARFTGPTGITTDGTNLYVTEYLNHTVRKVVIATGAVTTVAGGAGTAAKFNMPKGITTDGTSLYVADYANHSIRKIQ